MNQLALFAPEAPPPPPPLPPPAAPPAAPISASHRNYARMEKLMACPVIEAELMEIFGTRPNDWLTWSAYRLVIEKHGIGFGLGHKLGSMQRRGLLEEKVIYFGRGISANRPGSPDYQGFRIEYKLANFPHGREIARAA